MHGRRKLSAIESSTTARNVIIATKINKKRIGLSSNRTVFETPTSGPVEFQPVIRLQLFKRSPKVKKKKKTIRDDRLALVWCLNSMACLHGGKRERAEASKCIVSNNISSDQF